jgi:transcriptional regulator with XRE-family HTH domain
MMKIGEVSKRVGGLRKARGETQLEFAKRLEVTQPMVSAWEGGRDIPSFGAYLRLGNLASYPDNIWFWRQAGMDEQAILSAAEKLLRERGAPATKGEIVRVAPHQQTGQARQGADLPLPTQFIPNPGSTTYLRFDAQSAGSGFLPGDIVVLDRSYENAKDLRPFWNQVVLVEFPRRECGGLEKVPITWPYGLVMGRLRGNEFQDRDDELSWSAVLSPFVEPEAPVPLFPNDIGIGTWDFHLNAREPDDVKKKARADARAKIRLTEGCRILGRVICWFRPLREERK